VIPRTKKKEKEMKKLLAAITFLLLTSPIFAWTELGTPRHNSTNIGIANDTGETILVWIMPYTTFYPSRKVSADQLVGATFLKTSHKYGAYKGGEILLNPKERVWFTGHARGKHVPKSGVFDTMLINRRVVNLQQMDPQKGVIQPGQRREYVVFKRPNGDLVLEDKKIIKIDAAGNKAGAKVVL